LGVIMSWEPIHDAAFKGNLFCLERLVQSGYDVNAKDNSGWTPLHHVSQKRCAHRTTRVEMAEYLVERGGANVEAKDNLGRTALHRASSTGNVPIVQYLLEKGGANKEATDNRWKTPLHLACSFDHLEVARYLVENGANMEAKMVTAGHHSTLPAKRTTGRWFDIWLTMGQMCKPSATKESQH